MQLLSFHSLVSVFVCVFRLEVLLQRANKIQNMALDCEEKLTLAKNTLQAVSTHPLSSSPLISSHTFAVYSDLCWVNFG